MKHIQQTIKLTIALIQMKHIQQIIKLPIPQITLVVFHKINLMLIKLILILIRRGIVLMQMKLIQQTIKLTIALMQMKLIQQIIKLNQNTLKSINSPPNCLNNDSILKNNEKLDYPKKIDLFYNTTMFCHIFQSSLKEKERNRLSLFLTNDWINKVLLDRKVEDIKNSEFIQPLSERQKIQRKMEENKRIRKDFKSEIHNLCD